MKKYSLILASQSPRRKELLGHIQIPFEIKISEIEEISIHEHPIDVARDIACQKGRAVFRELPVSQDFYPFIVASDTIVTLGDKIYGKPTSIESAREMLLELSDKNHTVYTAVYIGYKSINSESFKETSFVCSTDVTFAKITEDLLSAYLQSNDSLDKAGAYGIQGMGLTFISRINGSYSNVVGFPLYEFVCEMKKILGDDANWRNHFNGVI